MHIGALRKWALALTFWLALQASSLKAQILGPDTESSATLKFDANGIFYVTGIGTGSLSLSGGGTEMFWYPKRAAFRAGSVSGHQWDDSGMYANIGNYSVAFGSNTIASGNYSTASGYVTTASGNYSTAMGVGSMAIGIGAAAFGHSSSAYGTGSTAMGFGSIAHGNYSTAIGVYATASGYCSSAIGANSTASAVFSSVFGEFTTANGSYSSASGYKTTATADLSFVLGRYNLGLNSSGGTASAGTWAPTDPLFEIGNGTSTTAADAMVVYKNGIVAVHNEIRTGAAGDLSMGNFTAGTPP